MEKQSNLREIKFNDLWKIFVGKLWVMVLAVVIVIVGFFVFNKLTFEPKYESTATLYILRQSSENSTVDQKVSEDFSLALNVVNDCTHLLKSHVVLDEVIHNLKLDISYDDLQDCISTSNPEDTRILEVTVEAADPATAKFVVDQICEIGESKIEKAMGFDQVNLFEKGVYDERPSNKINLMTYILIALVVAVLIYAVYLLRYLFDDRIKTDEEIERYLELSVIGDIPNAYGHKSKKNKYYGYGAYGAYGYSSKYGYSYKYKYKYKPEVIPEEPMTPGGVFMDNSAQIDVDSKNGTLSSKKDRKNGKK